MDWLKVLLKKADGTISKAKATALAALIVNLLQIWGVMELSPEQWASVNTALVTLFGIFLREGISPA